MTTPLRAMALLAVLAAGGAAPLLAQDKAAPEKVLLNLDRNGLAMKGYDPVSYFEPSGPLKGSTEFTALHDGATYRFANAENRDRFALKPTRYAPQFGGYCGYGASRNYLAPVDPEAFAIMDGRLILQYSKDVLRRWQEDPRSRLTLADENWSGLVEREGKPRRTSR